MTAAMLFPLLVRKANLLARVGLLATGLALLGCNPFMLAGGSSSTETGEPIQITGRVVSNGGAPVEGVVVRLAVNDLVDTTDADGRYSLSGQSRSRVSEDSLLFFQGGMTLAVLGVTSWAAEIPELQIVQRGFSGSITTGSVTVGRIEAVLVGDGIEEENPVIREFFYNTLAGNYSGFIYFPASDSVRNYEVRIDVRDANGNLIGQSVSVPFTSLAGNITIPAFAADNLLRSGAL